ncbi:MAG: tetratricopeptide repeat protein [Treponema sp.]|nr:tetratricopeptide repeat protein [Treponema sp.]
MQNDNDKTNTGDKINDFIQRNRKGIFITLGTLVVILIGVVAYFTVSDNLNKKAISELDELSARYAEINFNENEDYFTDEVDSFLSDITEFASKKKGFAGSKAWSFAALIYSGRKDWPKAEETWLNSAGAGDKTYLGPVALFNAAAAAEEQGKEEEAIKLLQKCIAHKFEFPAAPRAQFSIGRLYEQQENYQAALDAYRAVLINWPQMPVWQHLAKSRITAIEVK